MNYNKYATLLQNYRDVYDILKKEMKNLSEEQIMDFLSGLDKMNLLGLVCDYSPYAIGTLCTICGLYNFQDTQRWLINSLCLGASGAVISLIVSKVIFRICSERLFYKDKSYDVDEIYMTLEKNQKDIKEK